MLLPGLHALYDRLDVDVLAKKLARKRSHLAPDLMPRLKCSTCGGRSIILSSWAAEASEAA